MTGQGSTAGFLWLGLSRKRRKKKLGRPPVTRQLLSTWGWGPQGLFASWRVGVDPAGGFWDGSLQMRAWFRGWLRQAVGQSSIFIISSECFFHPLQGSVLLDGLEPCIFNTAIQLSKS